MHATATKPLNPMRICAGVVALIDDDAFVLRALQRALTAYAYRVKTFSSAEQYLEEARLAEISCVVVDVELGDGMSGLELGKRLARSAPSIPVIYMSGALNTAVRRRAYDAGAVAFLDKPFLVSALLAELMKLDNELS